MTIVRRPLTGAQDRPGASAVGSSSTAARFVLASLARWLTVAELEDRGFATNAAVARYRPPASGALRPDEAPGHAPALYADAPEAATPPNAGRNGGPDALPVLPASATRRPAASPYLPLNTVHATDPRISTVSRCVGALLRVVSLERGDGTAVEADGFHLKHLRAWQVATRPGNTEPIEHYLAAGVCNANCEFCYEHGTPPEMRTPRQRVRLSELETRLKYYEPERGRALFDMFHQYYDAFSHPHWFEVLQRVRARTDGVLDMITNGRVLTDETVARLGQLRPVRLTISLNSADPGRRARVMRDRTPEVAATSLTALGARRIPFGIVVVPWPPELDEDDLERTIRFVDPFKPLFVIVSLPGYTRYFPSPPEALTEAYHRRVVERLRTLREQVDTPLLVQPRMAEAVWHGEDHSRPFVLGTTPGTPARRARIRRGDVIERINGLEMRWAYQAQRFFELLDQVGTPEVEVALRRGERRWETTLTRTPADDGDGFGLILAQGINPAVFDAVWERIEQVRPRPAWILSSFWMQDVVTSHLAALSGDGCPPNHVSVIPAPSRYFGGNIQLGDLLVVDDYVEVIAEELAARRKRPALIVIPTSPFTAWGRDLRGKCYLEITRRFDIPILFAGNNRIMV